MIFQKWISILSFSAAWLVWQLVNKFVLKNAFVKRKLWTAVRKNWSNCPANHRLECDMGECVLQLVSLKLLGFDCEIFAENVNWWLINRFHGQTSRSKPNQRIKAALLWSVERNWANLPCQQRNRTDRTTAVCRSGKAPVARLAAEQDSVHRWAGVQRSVFNRKDVSWSNF